MFLQLHKLILWLHKLRMVHPLAWMRQEYECIRVENISDPEVCDFNNRSRGNCITKPVILMIDQEAIASTNVVLRFGEVNES